MLKMRAILSELRSERKQEYASLVNREQTDDSHATAGGFVPALVDALLIDTVSCWLEQGRLYHSLDCMEVFP